MLLSLTPLTPASLGSSNALSLARPVLPCGHHTCFPSLAEKTARIPPAPSFRPWINSLSREASLATQSNVQHTHPSPLTPHPRHVRRYLGAQDTARSKTRKLVSGAHMPVLGVEEWTQQRRAAFRALKKIVVRDTLLGMVSEGLPKEMAFELSKCLSKTRDLRREPGLE